MRKKLIVTVVLVGLMAAALWAAGRQEVVPFDRSGSRVNPGQVHTLGDAWQVINSTVAAGVEPSDLNVGSRNWEAVDDKIDEGEDGNEKMSFFDIPRGWNAARFRISGLDNNGTGTYLIYLGTLGQGNKAIMSSITPTADCALSLLGSFSFVIGTQAVGQAVTQEFADQITTTAGQWSAVITTISPGTGSERIAEFSVDLLGADLIVVVPTATDTTIELLARGY